MPATVVVCGTRIGRHAFAAAGSVITRDVPAHAFVAGNPAAQRGWVCECGEPLAEDLSCSACGRSHERATTGDLRERCARPMTIAVGE